MAPGAPAKEQAAVAVVRAGSWSAPSDTAHEGADEFAVLMNLAAVQRDHALTGLVGVGNQRGSFQDGEERAFRFAALSGVPVLKVATKGAVVHCPDGLFIEADSLPESEACRLLADALERFGAPPRAANPSQPTEAEILAISRHVERMQGHIAMNRGIRVTQN
jgi:L-asparaginase